MGGTFSQHADPQLESNARALDRWLERIDREVEHNPSRLVSFMISLHKMTDSASGVNGVAYNLIRDCANLRSLKRFIAVCKQDVWITLFQVPIRSGALYPRAAVLAALIARRLDLVEQLLPSSCDTYGLFMQCVLNRDLWSRYLGTELLEDAPSMSDPNIRVLVHWAIGISRRCDPAKRVLQMLWPYISAELDKRVKNDIFLKSILDGDFEFFAFLKAEMIPGDCHSRLCQVKSYLSVPSSPGGGIFICPRAVVVRCVCAITDTRFHLNSLPSPIPGVLSQRRQQHRRLVHFLVKAVECGLSTQCGFAGACPYFQHFCQPSGLWEAARNGDLDLVRLLVRTGAARNKELCQLSGVVRTRLAITFRAGRPEPRYLINERKQRKEELFRYVQGVIKNPRSLSQLCVFAVSHALGGGGDRNVRASQLPIPRPQQEAVLFHDVLTEFLEGAAGAI